MERKYWCIDDGRAIGRPFSVTLTKPHPDVEDLQMAINDKLKLRTPSMNLILYKWTKPHDADNKSILEVEKLPEKVELDPQKFVSSLALDADTYILVQKPPDEARPSSPQLGVKRARTEENLVQPFLKRFHPNSTVYMQIRPLVYYADQTDNNKPLIQRIHNGEFVRVFGARASGKSSRIVDAMEVLKDFYECFYVDFSDLTLSSEEAFWSSLCNILKLSGTPLAFNSVHGFHNAFNAEHKRWTRQVVIFFDEFDRLHEPYAVDICSSMLSQLRSIRNEPSRGSNKPSHVIRSIVSIGTYAILELNQTESRLSPFNSSDNFQNRSLSMDQVHDLYREFAADRRMTIDNDVVGCIFSMCNGHAGLVNICGVALEKSLSMMPLPLRVNMTHWESVANRIIVAMESYGTFQRLIRDLRGESEHQKAALAFYRSRFLGNASDVTLQVTAHPDRELARFLVALGLLLAEEEDGTGDGFKVASPLMDSFVLQIVIPSMYRNAPTTSPPLRDGSLDVMEIIKSALHFFDKLFIYQAHGLSYKSSPYAVLVNGSRRQSVPRESVYDSEMTRIFRNWLSTLHGYEVIGQRHISSLYCDIVLRRGVEQPPIVLELLATSTAVEIQQYIERTVRYKNLMGTNEGWVVYFTREDNYLLHPYWPGNGTLDTGIKMVHIWHNQHFTEVRLSARWKTSDGQMITVDGERVI
ncbi:hypothetical protein EMPS_09986 [Entomortierella parvispora]|uniref:Uncharacterized protein n=1 Tax=Entomortierella parvispora TaxID=205924 RepID=A0A9P3HJX7_9FUNG|nr:hypothetical protein EMPS_09986 [Entomortierella parvispora]